MLAALPSLLLAAPQCRDGWTNYTEGSSTKCVMNTYESHGVTVYQNDCLAVCSSLARTWLDANDPTPQPLCVKSGAEVAWWNANSPRATFWTGLSRDGPSFLESSSWEGAPWGPAASPAHLDNQCIASASSFYEQVFAHTPTSEGGGPSDAWAGNDPGFIPGTQDHDGKENCILAINENTAGGDNPGGGFGWCARPPAQATAPPSAAPARPDRAPPDRAPRAGTTSPATHGWGIWAAVTSRATGGRRTTAPCACASCLRRSRRRATTSPSGSTARSLTSTAAARHARFSCPPGR